jgi:hypothetical protein
VGLRIIQSGLVDWASIVHIVSRLEEFSSGGLQVFQNWLFLGGHLEAFCQFEQVASEGLSLGLYFTTATSSLSGVPESPHLLHLCSWAAATCGYGSLQYGTLEETQRLTASIRTGLGSTSGRSALPRPALNHQSNRWRNATLSSWID